MTPSCVFPLTAEGCGTRLTYASIYQQNYSAVTATTLQDCWRLRWYVERKDSTANNCECCPIWLVSSESRSSSDRSDLLCGHYERQSELNRIGHNLQRLFSFLTVKSEGWPSGRQAPILKRRIETHDRYVVEDLIHDSSRYLKTYGEFDMRTASGCRIADGLHQFEVIFMFRPSKKPAWWKYVLYVFWA